MIINDWKMDFGKYKGLTCTLPADMYSVLFAHGIIPDPYYGLNELDLTDLSRKDCTFYSEFSLTNDELLRERIMLSFYGLDTICDIYFNDKLLDSVKNCHRLYEYDIKALARENNEIRLEFKSPVNYYEAIEKSHHLYTNCDSLKGAAHLRKALYMSGWDWAPTLPNMGIFRKVEISAYDGDKIADTYISQIHKNGEVILNISASTKHGLGGKITATVDGQTVDLVDGKCEITIKNPRLWWPNGYGEQNLYDVTFSLYSNNEVVDTVTKTIGLRTLALSQEKDEFGQEFCFKVNGIKIFSMGANYVPLDSLPSRISKERTEQLIKDCIFANFNSIRVWGGGFYPDDYFYELCDKYGLIVWQDFMIACANVWMTPENEKEFRLEAIYNVKRIRHHACLGILCGNNEMEEAICGWECANGNDPLVRQDYLKLYEEILPEICKEYAPEISYTPSSPTSGGGFDSPQDYTRGDVHFWHVWNGGCGFDEYRNHKFRFCSEYGFQSLPDIKTIEYFCPPSEMDVLSKTMLSHQKNLGGNQKLLRFMREHYPEPKNMEMTTYATQLNQANAIAYGVEHFRRCRGYTMGSIYWQLNDSWPVASWSSVDYFGRYKALHYFAKKFYAPIAIGLFNDGDTMTVNVANESLSDFKGYLKAGVSKNDFTAISEQKTEVVVESLSSLDALCLSNKDFNGKADCYFYAELYDENDILIAKNTLLGTEPKDFEFKKPNINIEATNTDGGVYLTLSSDVIIKNLEISFKHHDIILSDNYFDLSSNKPYKVFASTDLTPSEILDDIKIISVYDID
ncbi:MAG: glycoside hydrolase family 2 protein [Clostridia bacterium]|nr:glycoside hydrolase family 2 protein [Clostridia bacterium]